jgi:MFS family permease
MMMPARQAMTPDIVGTERLMNAIALNTSGMNVARLLMPGLAGFGIAALGGGGGDIDAAKYVYFLMFVLYLWAIVGLLFVRVPDRPTERGPTQPILHELVQGLRYVWETSELRLLLAANFLMVFFSMAYFTLLPGFAKSVLDAGPDRLGLMTSISGIGALVGSLVVASLPNRRRGRALLLAALLVGVALIGFSFTTSYWLSVAFLVAVGAGQAARMSLSNALVQSYSQDEYRGRVMSIYMMEFSLMSLGIYGVGVLANTVGPQIAIGSTALGLVILVVGLFCFSPRYRNLQ